MFGISSTELVIVLLFGFLLFGPDKLPQMGRTIGRALRQFRETQEKLTAVVQTEVVDPMAAAAQKPLSGDARVSGAEDDSDVAEPVSSEPARKETFAERRARLAAEREAAQAAAASQEASDAAADGDVRGGDGVSAPADTASRDGGSSGPAASAAQGGGGREVAEGPHTTEDLYARRPRKRKSVDEDPAESSPTEESKGGEQ